MLFFRFDRRMPSFNPYDPLDVNMTGGVVVEVVNHTSPEAVADMDVVPNKFQLTVLFTRNSFSVNVPYNVTQDAITQPNPAAGPLTATYPGYDTPTGICFGSEYAPYVTVLIFN